MEAEFKYVQKSQQNVAIEITISYYQIWKNNS